jgi:hypothetical protein
MSWACSKTKEGRGKCRAWVRKSEGKRPHGSPNVDGRIILRCFFKKWDMESWTGMRWQKQVVGAYECCNEPSGSIKYGEFLD